MQPQGELCASLMLSRATGCEAEILKICIHNAIGLAASDSGGTSDPYGCLTHPKYCITYIKWLIWPFNRYAKALVGDMVKVTSVKTKTLNPSWDETFELLISNANAAVVLQVDLMFDKAAVLCAVAVRYALCAKAVVPCALFPTPCCLLLPAACAVYAVRCTLYPYTPVPL